MIRTKVTSPDQETFRKVSTALSRSGASVAASSNTTFTQVVTSKITDRLNTTLTELGATLEQM